MEMKVKVSGTPAAVVFSIFTKDQAAKSRNIRNGHLGWHFVNMVDTCVYLSPEYRFQPGENTVVWDGRDENGAKMTRQDYTYYLWAFDDSSPSREVTRSIRFPRFDRSFLQCQDRAGSPLAQPVLYSSASPLESAGETWNTRARWIIGNDPSDASLTETTRDRSWPDNGQMAFDYWDESCFFTQSLTPGALVMTKWKWASNGDAELQPAWGDNGRYTHPTSLNSANPLYSGPVGDISDYLFYTNTFALDSEEWHTIIYVDRNDGSEIKRVNLAPWWSSDGESPFGPSAMCFSRGSLFLNSPQSCIAMMFDPYMEEDDAMVQWVNGNGDGIGDKNYEPGVPNPRVCADPDLPPFAGRFAVDNCGFAAFPVEGMGSASFGLFAPDGSGAGYFTLFGVESRAVRGLQIADTGSAYDGLYYGYGGVTSDSDSAGVRYTGYDVFKGMIWRGCDWEPYDPTGVTAPVAGESIRAGSSYTIAWYYYMTDIPCFVEFSMDGGATWATITDSTAVASYPWTVPDVESSHCRVRVTSFDHATFTALSPEFTITGPVGIAENAAAP
ncbi:MAG TPA: hypothetical protein VHR86_06290, partial [Armatimonadota bacterium]|nr:hypothetical protein [Armatimonadota bacterium]